MTASDGDMYLPDVWCTLRDTAELTVAMGLLVQQAVFCWLHGIRCAHSTALGLAFQKFMYIAALRQEAAAVLADIPVQNERCFQE